jgi:hypothetical protein
LLAALLGTALSACSPPTPGPSTGSAVVLARENLSPDFIGFIGRKTQHAPPFLGISETNYYCLRSFVDRRTGETVHQLYFSDSYFGPVRDWNAARDGSGRPLLFVPLTRDEIACDPGCSYVEEFAVSLPESAFRTNPEDLPITLVTRSGDEKTILVTGRQIAAQLAAIDARRNPAHPVAAISITPP